MNATCVVCGGPCPPNRGPPRKACSVPCREELNRRIKRAAHRRYHPVPAPVPCVVCGRLVERAAHQLGPTPDVCSEACRRVRNRAFQRALEAAKEPKAEGACVICGGTLPPYGKAGAPPEVCSAECRAKREQRRRELANERAKQRHASDPFRREKARTYARERQRMKAADPILRARRDRLNREWAKANKEHLRARDRTRNKTEKRRAWTRQRDLDRAYGITPEKFDAKLASQGGKCAVCSVTDPGGKGGWHLDHDHALDPRDQRSHRGLLCHACNTALGAFNDSPTLLRAAAAYLQRHGAGSTV